ncbi:uncharacterized protein LOC132745308 [Ruditapes philippinarum]|uniref:uncharacterized protein LOC132745308 n=1 Tax=Ruditapes philippinarum TaxID=129788 RepID=UPI00295AF0A2|nr:uncharacterized protein LOC132745308 [Ruditapes philippinarum]
MNKFSVNQVLNMLEDSDSDNEILEDSEDNLKLLKSIPLQTNTSDSDESANNLCVRSMSFRDIYETTSKKTLEVTQNQDVMPCTFNNNNDTTVNRISNDDQVQYTGYFHISGNNETAINRTTDMNNIQCPELMNVTTDVIQVHCEGPLSFNCNDEATSNTSTDMNQVQYPMTINDEFEMKRATYINPQESSVSLNVYDLNSLPASFLDELNNDNVCMVSENSIDVFANFNQTSCQEVDTFVYSRDTNEEYDILDLDKHLDNNNNISLPNRYEAAKEDCIYEETNSNLSNEIENENDNTQKSDQSQVFNGPINENINNQSCQNGTVTRGRKRVRNNEMWSKTINKRRRQAGKEYINRQGVKVPQKRVSVKTNCKGTSNCRRKCTQQFSDEQIQAIHDGYWSLDDDGGKNGFIARTITRRTNENKKKDSNRRYTYEFFFFRNDDKIQVCKDFYLGVLHISDNRYRQYFKKVDTKEGNEFRDMRGKRTKRRKSEDEINVIRKHIESFQRIPSHYCRSNSSKEYLEPGLNVNIMYKLYLEHCANILRKPLKRGMYREIFNKEYNIGFHIPKKDRCDLCEAIKIRADNNSLNSIEKEFQEKYKKHICDKKSTKMERDKDRMNKTDMIVSFDLENVILLPKANVSNFFYKRKLATYNLTAHVSKDGTAYNCIWNEIIGGRGANEIASAIVTILKDVKRVHPTIKYFTLWSDNCIPQNKNSIMTIALKRFMNDYDIDCIVQKFGCPGHSCVQEVDNIHSNIERITRYTEIYSPLSLIRVLKSLNMKRKNAVRFIQMQKHHFMDYQKSIMPLKFNDIPYTKVKCLKYEKARPFSVGYKLSYEEDVFKTVIIATRKTRQSLPILELPNPKMLKCHRIMSDQKKKDISEMLKYMPEVDQQFYKASKLVTVKQ